MAKNSKAKLTFETWELVDWDFKYDPYNTHWNLPEIYEQITRRYSRTKNLSYRQSSMSLLKLGYVSLRREFGRKIDTITKQCDEQITFMFDGGFKVKPEILHPMLSNYNNGLMRVHVLWWLYPHMKEIVSDTGIKISCLGRILLAHAMINTPTLSSYSNIIMQATEDICAFEEWLEKYEGALEYGFEIMKSLDIEPIKQACLNKCNRIKSQPKTI